MIVEQLMGLLHGLANGLFSWARNALPQPPSWMADLTSGMVTIVDMIPEAVRWFVPLGPTVAIALSLAGLFVAAGLIRLARRVLSVFTGGGGNA